MKKSEIAMVILIAAVSIMVAFAIANSIPGLKVDEKGEKVQVAEKISSDVKKPDESVFNSSAINPTVKTVIGQ